LLIAFAILFVDFVLLFLLISLLDIYSYIAICSSMAIFSLISRISLSG